MVVAIAATGFVASQDEATSQVNTSSSVFPAALLYEATPVPDRIALTWTGDPAHSIAVSWRTDNTVATPVAQIASATGGPGFTGAITEITEVANTPVPPADVATPATFHTAQFTDLDPETKYLYRVGDGMNWSEWFEFETASEQPEPFSFVYFGDAQNDLKEHWSRVIRRSYSDRPEAKFIVHAGDLVNTSTSDAEWAEWHYAGGWINGMVPSVPTPGNHEYAGATLSPLWRPGFELPLNGPQGTGVMYEAMKETVYYIDYQGVRIISLNSNSVAAAGNTQAWYDIQAQWLEGVLQNNPNKWTVLTFHHPVFANEPSRDNPVLRNAWLPLIEQYDVDLVLQGHDHSYARGNLGTGLSGVEGTTVYVVSVSGPKMYNQDASNWDDNGAKQKKAIKDTQLYQLIDVTNGVLRYEARKANGESYDVFEIHKDEHGEKRIFER
jgi:3',5'-cyclic AMP phosphodiesterase CpdA